jgi:RNA polymerase sigma factor (TIGR02999 family)
MLIDWSAGRKEVLEQLVPAVYQELRRLAAGYLRRQPPGHTLTATALVHEAYLRLVDQAAVSWHSRTQFFGIAANLMRQILMQHARRRQAAKRGGGSQSRLSLDEAMYWSDERAADFVALDDALNRLAALDPQKSRIVELRFFAGLTIEETAEVLAVSPMTVKREWNMAKAWLYKRMKDEG